MLSGASPSAATLVIFGINQYCVLLNPTVNMLGLIDCLKFVFLDLNVRVILVTWVIVQLATQMTVPH